MISPKRFEFVAVMGDDTRTKFRIRNYTADPRRATIVHEIVPLEPA